MTVLPAGSIFFDILALSPWTKLHWIDMRLIALALVAAGMLGAQELSRVRPPTIISKVEPQYSEEARKAGLEGMVLLKIVVDPEGKARDPKVLRSLGLGLDEQAIVAVNNWQFQPGVKDGQPVPVQAQIEVNFRLLEKGATLARSHLAHVEFQLPPGASRPVVQKTGAPRAAEDPPGATATVTFDINEEGVPVNLRVEKASEDEWGSRVTEALGNWRFTPASKDGTAISVSCTMEFVRGN
jgi:TonB family protein